MTTGLLPPNLEVKRQRVLVVEDDYFLANDLAAWLKRQQATVIGPAAGANDAIRLIEDEEVDFAFLDLNLNSVVSFEVAEKLTAHGIPFIFSTGMEKEKPQEFADVPVLLKPLDMNDPALGLSTRHRTAQEWAPRNLLLASMPRDILMSLRPHMAIMPMARKRTLARARTPIDRVYFPEKGLVSLLVGPSSKPVEVGLIGSESCLGAVVLDDVTSHPFHALVQMTGFCLAVTANAFKTAISRDAATLLEFRKRDHALLMQIAHTAASAATQSVEQRLARWLLLCSDRQGSRLDIVHEHIALMLGVRRAGVTNALHSLQRLGALSLARGEIRILDRTPLEQLAGWAYKR